ANFAGRQPARGHDVSCPYGRVSLARRAARRKPLEAASCCRGGRAELAPDGAPDLACSWAATQRASKRTARGGFGPRSARTASKDLRASETLAPAATRACAVSCASQSWSAGGLLSFSSSVARARDCWASLPPAGEGDCARATPANTR